MTITDTQLLDFNRQGLIPGPDETEAAFLERARYCLRLKDEIADKLGAQLPFSEADRSSGEFLLPSLAETRQQYDISPGWIPLFFSNFHLYPWHGGCAWIFQQSEETPTAAFLQLRRAFAQSENYLGLYSRKELIAHELCHVGRMCFEEPRFEEIIAYRTSSSNFRRWLGAIVQSSWEATAFFLLLCLIFAVDLYALSAGTPHLMESLSWLKLIPLSLVAAGLYRLYKRQRQFAQCLASLQALLQGKAEAVIYRLTDQEIVAFSQMEEESLRAALAEKRGSSLRWRCIEKAYL